MITAKGLGKIFKLFNKYTFRCGNTANTVDI
jgi:hypothetical protein